MLVPCLKGGQVSADVADTWFGLCEPCMDNWSSFFFFLGSFDYEGHI